VKSSEDLVDEGLGLSRLLSDEVTTALLSDLDESIAGHVLNSLVRFVHKLEKLVDDRLEELPVGLEESRVLSDDIHDAEREKAEAVNVSTDAKGEKELGASNSLRSDDGLVVLPSLDLAETEKILDDLDQETLLSLLV